MPGKSGFGTKLKRGDGAATEVFTEIAGVTNITPFNITRETHDTTNMATADGYKTCIGGLKDSGEPSVDVNYDPADHNTLLADFDDAAPRNYQVVFPGGEVADFAAVMTGFAPTAPMEDKMTATLTFKISGKIAWS